MTDEIRSEDIIPLMPSWIEFDAERARADAAEARVAAGDALADYVDTLVPNLDTRQQRAEVRGLIDAWRALRDAQPAPGGGGEGS